MIRNERQYRVTQSERAKLALELQRTPGSDVPDWVAEASRNAIASQVVEMDEALADYDALRVGAVSSAAEVNDLADLPRALIRARIAGRLTQRDLAERLVFVSTSPALRGNRLRRCQHRSTSPGHGRPRSHLRWRVDAAGPGWWCRRATTHADRVGHRRQDRDAPVLRRERGAPAAAGWMNAAARAARIFQTSVDDLMSGNVVAVANRGSFRTSTVADRDTVHGYARYAEYLAERLALAVLSRYRASARCCPVAWRPR